MMKTNKNTTLEVLFLFRDSFLPRHSMAWKEKISPPPRGMLKYKKFLTETVYTFQDTLGGEKNFPYRIHRFCKESFLKSIQTASALSESIWIGLAASVT